MNRPTAMLLIVALAAGGLFFYRQRDNKEHENDRPDGRAGSADSADDWPIDWPEGVTKAARALLEPALRALVAVDAAGAAGLRTDASARAFAGRELLVLEVLREPSIRVFESGDPEGRRLATAILRHWVDRTKGDLDAVIDRLPLRAIETAIVGGESLPLRRDLVGLLADLPRLRAFLILARALQDDEVTIRRQVVRALAESVRSDRPKEMRERAATAIANHALVEKDAGVLAEIFDAWTREPFFRSRPGLKEASRPHLASSSVAVRIAAIRLAGVLSDREAITLLATATLVKDRDVRLAAVEALGRIRDPAAKSALEALTDPGEADAKFSDRLRWARSRQK